MIRTGTGIWRATVACESHEHPLEQSRGPLGSSCPSVRSSCQIVPPPGMCDWQALTEGRELKEMRTNGRSSVH
jgi:hypothetical protein